MNDDPIADMIDRVELGEVFNIYRDGRPGEQDVPVAVVVPFDAYIVLLAAAMRQVKP